MAKVEDLEIALADITRALDSFNPPGMIIGGIAVLAKGYARATRDIDATIAAPADYRTALNQFTGYHILPRIPDALPFAQKHRVFLLQHRPTQIPIDITLAQLPFEQAAMAHAQPTRRHGLLLRIPRLQDLLVYKLVASRPQDLLDAEELLLVSRETVDPRKVSSILKEFATVLERPEIVSAWKLIWRRTRGRPRKKSLK